MRPRCLSGLFLLKRIGKKKFDNFDMFRSFYLLHTYNYAFRCWCGLGDITPKNKKGV